MTDTPPQRGDPTLAASVSRETAFDTLTAPVIATASADTAAAAEPPQCATRTRTRTQLDDAPTVASDGGVVSAAAADTPATGDATAASAGDAVPVALDALVASGHVQTRMETACAPTSNANQVALEQAGPLPVSKLPKQVQMWDRYQDGIAMFKFGAIRGEGDRLMTRQSPVAYLPASHAKKAVLDAYFDAHPNVLEAKTKRGLRQHLADHGDEWLAAAKPILDAHYGRLSDHGGGSRVTGGTCPFCDGSYQHSLATHLPCAGSATNSEKDDN